MENLNQEILQAIQMLATKMDEGLNQLRKDFAKRFDTLEKKVDSIQDEVADLKEWRTTVDEKLDTLLDLEEVTKVNCYEITKLKTRKAIL